MADAVEGLPEFKNLQNFLKLTRQGEDVSIEVTAFPACPGMRLNLCRTVSVWLLTKRAVIDTLEREGRRRGPVEGKTVVVRDVLTPHPCSTTSDEMLRAVRALQELVRIARQEDIPAAIDRVWRASIVLNIGGYKMPPEIYSQLRNLYSATILAARKVVTWIGFDSDGHSSESSHLNGRALREMANQERREMISWYVARLIPMERAALPRLCDQLSRIIIRLSATKDGLGSSPQAYSLVAEFLTDLAELEPRETQVEAVIRDVREFGFSLWTPQPRFDARALNGLWTSTNSGQGEDLFSANDRWLKDILLGLRDVSATTEEIPTAVLSGTEKIEDLMNAQQILDKYGPRTTVIPLFETSIGLSEARSTWKAWIEFLRKTGRMPVRPIFMVGFSDAGRECGMVWATLKARETIKKIFELSKELGVTELGVELGAGADIARGGVTNIEDFVVSMLPPANPTFPSEVLVTLQGDGIAVAYGARGHNSARPDVCLRTAEESLDTEFEVFLQAWGREQSEWYGEHVYHSQALRDWLNTGSPCFLVPEVTRRARPVSRMGEVSLKGMRAITSVLTGRAAFGMGISLLGAGTALKRIFKRDSAAVGMLGQALLHVPLARHMLKGLAEAYALGDPAGLLALTKAIAGQDGFSMSVVELIESDIAAGQAAFKELGLLGDPERAAASSFFRKELAVLLSESGGKLPESGAHREAILNCLIAIFHSCGTSG
ncbi:MAG: phosphoenolpyruvate carboxylase [Deltaproteobacteria bacterium]|nr:phosphoenolpyruvate carboxylase [Deltaproteobacteria bacterium]